MDSKNNLFIKCTLRYWNTNLTFFSTEYKNPSIMNFVSAINDRIIPYPYYRH